MEIFLIIRRLLQFTGLAAFDTQHRRPFLQLIHKCLISLFQFACLISMSVFTIKTDNLHDFSAAFYLTFAQFTMFLTYSLLAAQAKNISHFINTLEKVINDRVKISPALENVYFEANTAIEILSKYSIGCGLLIAVSFYFEWLLASTWTIFTKTLQSDHLENLFPLA